MHCKPGKKPDKKDNDKKNNHAFKPSGRFIFISLYHHLTYSMKFMIKCKVEFQDIHTELSEDVPLRRFGTLLDEQFYLFCF
jgi:hypothetical protein